jgi:ubiquitin-conjugating enzyme E2 A
LINIFYKTYINNLIYFVIKRLTKELSKLKEESDKLDGIIIDDPQDILIWNAKMMGPPDTPYQDGTFEMLLKFDSDYPRRPPSVKFLTSMYHPNIYRDGKICIDPNPSSPANREAAELFNKDRIAYDNKVREFVKINK